MDAVFSNHNGIARITLAGDFTFEAHRQFSAASQAVLGSTDIGVLELDFGAVDYMDSAALGMLLLLQERFRQGRIRLLGAHGSVRAVLDVANFGSLFEIA